LKVQAASRHKNKTERTSAERRAISPRRRPIVDLYGAVAIVTLTGVFLLACIEVAAVFADNLWQEPRAARVSYYASQPWAHQYWKEFTASHRQSYRSFVTWRRVPFQGAFINIDRDGRRVTPGAVCSADSYKVFAFGGSTMWGTGSPDAGTIPAYLQTDLSASRQGPVCVMNFGESAYGSTHGVIQLTLELRSGHVPDLVIFYDGVNDTFSAYQSGRSTLHRDITQIAAKFETPSSPSIVAWGKASHSYRLLERLLTKDGRNRSTYKTKGIDTEALSSEVVRTYLANYEVVKALARKYGFTPVFFWQPVLPMCGKPLTGEEQEMKAEEDPALLELFQSAYRRVEQAAKTHEGLHYMGDVFDDFKPLVWLDDAHVTPEGNRIVAQKMLQVTKQRTMSHNQAPWLARSADARGG
jgi:hypothetical protein